MNELTYIIPIVLLSYFGLFYLGYYFGSKSTHKAYMTWQDGFDHAILEFKKYEDKK